MSKEAIITELLLRNTASETSQDKHFQILLDFLKQLNLEQVVDFYQLIPGIDILFSHDIVKPFWASLREDVPVPGCSNFHFMAQSNLSDQLFVLGYINFLKYRKIKRAGNNNNDLGQKYLQLAIKYHSFHALETAVRDLRLEIQKNTQHGKTNVAAIEILKDFHSLLEQEAKWHGSPTYLLLARIYFLLAKTLTDRQEVESSYYLTMKYLRLAKLCLETSKASIHNAYFGQGLANSNPFLIDDIDTLQEACFKDAKEFLTDDSRKRAFFDAEHIYKKPASANTLSDAIALSNTFTTSSLMQAVIKDSPKDIYALVNSKASQLEETNQWGETPLLVAARLGHIKSFRCLLALGANAYATDKRQNTTLHLALGLGHLNISHLLVHDYPTLLAGENSFQLTPKMLSTEENCQHVLTSGAEAQAQLTAAIYKGDISEIKLYLSQDISPNFLLPSGEPPLCYLARQNHQPGIELLLDYGASTNCLDTKGHSALYHAIANGCYEAVQLLLLAGANANQADIITITQQCINFKIKQLIHEKLTTGKIEPPIHSIAVLFKPLNINTGTVTNATSHQAVEKELGNCNISRALQRL